MGKPSGASVKVFGAAFFKRLRPCPYRRAAHEKKLGKQPGNLWLPAPFPDGGAVALSVTAAAVPALPKGEPSLASPFGGRWCPVGTVQRLVSAAASVGDGRSPLGCITRAGRRECPRRGRRGQPASGTSPKQSLFALTYRPAVPYNHTTSWGSSLLGLPSGNVNTLANAWYCLKKRDSWKTSI